MAVTGQPRTGGRDLNFHSPCHCEARSLPEMCEQIQKFTRENNDKIIMGFGASTHFVMVILNRNPPTLKPSELLSLKVENLLLKGEPYQKGQGILILATF